MVVRADAGPATGTGHVMRCLALGQEWVRQGGKVEFLSRGTNDLLRQRLESAGFRLTPVDRPHPDQKDLRSTLIRLDRLAVETGARPWLVLDGYHFDEDYQSAIRRAGHRLLVIDDFAPLNEYQADIILNQNTGSEDRFYNCRPDTLLLLGSRYVLLRPEFLAFTGWKRQIPELATKILVTLGGSDPNNVTLKVIGALGKAELGPAEVRIVVGPENPNLKALKGALAGLGLNAELTTKVKDMPHLMSWADLAVSAGGTTAWEMAFMGLPSAVIILAENQVGVARGLERQGAGLNLGWFDQVTQDKLGQVIKDLAQDHGLRKKLSLGGHQLVDGWGIKRVATLIKAIEDRSIDLNHLQSRRALASDALSLWRLANDPFVRANSFNPETIPLETHLEWHRQKLVSPGTSFWVLEIGGAVVAQIRYERRAEETAEVNYSVVPTFRGKGLGTQALRLTGRPACRELGCRKIRGLVLPGNQASVKAFLKAGFGLAGATEHLGQSCQIFERNCP